MVVERLRTGASWLHLVIAAAIVVGVFAQVYLIGAYIFGAGRDALDAHEGVGWAVHSLEWTGALHPLGALIVLIGAAILVRGNLRLRRLRSA